MQTILIYSIINDKQILEYRKVAEGFGEGKRPSDKEEVAISITMVKSGSNLCGLSPHVFWLISFYFSEIRFFYKRHLNI